MAVTAVVTVAHSDWEKFTSFIKNNKLTYDYLGHSDDGKYVRLYNPVAVFDLIEHDIKISM